MSEKLRFNQQVNEVVEESKKLTDLGLKSQLNDMASLYLEREGSYDWFHYACFEKLVLEFKNREQASSYQEIKLFRENSEGFFSPKWRKKNGLMSIFEIERALKNDDGKALVANNMRAETLFISKYKRS